MDVLTISCVQVSMFAQTTHCVQIRDRGFGGDDMGLLDLMPANISPGAISFAIKCMMEGGGVCFGPDAETLA